MKLCWSRSSGTTWQTLQKVSSFWPPRFLRTILQGRRPQGWMPASAPAKNGCWLRHGDSVERSSFADAVRVHAMPDGPPNPYGFACILRIMMARLSHSRRPQNAATQRLRRLTSCGQQDGLTSSRIKLTFGGTGAHSSCSLRPFQACRAGSMKPCPAGRDARKRSASRSRWCRDALARTAAGRAGRAGP